MQSSQKSDSLWLEATDFSHFIGLQSDKSKFLWLAVSKTNLLRALGTVYICKVCNSFRFYLMWISSIETNYVLPSDTTLEKADNLP